MQQMLVRYAVSDKEGRYKLDCLLEGTYDLYVQHDAGTVIIREIKIGKSSEQKDIILQPGVKVSGTISIQGGNDAAEVMIMVLDVERDEPRSYAMTDADGKFEIEQSMPAGDYVILAYKDGYAIESEKITLKEPFTYKANLVPGGDVQVTVKSGGGKNISGSRIFIKTEDGRKVHRTYSFGRMDFGAYSGFNIKPLDKNGTTEIKGLKPGKYIIGVEKSDKTATVEVKALEVSSVNLNL